MVHFSKFILQNFRDNYIDISTFDDSVYIYSFRFGAAYEFLFCSVCIISNAKKEATTQFGRLPPFKLQVTSRSPGTD